MKPPFNLEHAPRRIVVRGVNWLGDAVMTTPALQRLRERFGDAHITLLTPQKLADLWVGHPALDAVMPFQQTDSAMKVGSMLRTGNFDLGIALPNSTRTALELWLGGVPRRVGYAGSGRSLMLTHSVERRTDLPTMRKRTEAEIKRLISGEEAGGTAGYSTEAHHLHHYLQLLASLGCDATPVAPFIAVSDTELKAMHIRLGMLELDGAKVPLFGLNPGAEYGPAKRWPAERFVAAAIELHKRTGCRWVVFGGKADIETAANIAAQIQHAVRRHQSTPGETTISTVVNLAGQTTLRELCAALKACDLLLTNDTGPMHVAAAVGTPVVVPFGSTSPELTGPGMPGETLHRFIKSGAACAPCFLRECPVDFRCMNGISVERVVEEVMASGEGQWTGGDAEEGE